MHTALFHHHLIWLQKRNKNKYSRQKLDKRNKAKAKRFTVSVNKAISPISSKIF